MRITTHGTVPPRCELGDVIAHRIDPDIWRVRDRTMPSHDALCVLGIIERNDHGFESLVIGDRGRRRHSATFDEALLIFATVKAGQGGDDVQR